jgi:hypothetical protein
MSKNKIKYHFLYKTPNLINSKYYYGMHSTYKLDDGYLGSGKMLRYSIRKYGKENFNIEIIEFFPSREDLVNAEMNLITEEMIVDNKLCMNLKKGGLGGFTKEQSHKGALRMLDIIWSDSDFITRHNERKSKLIKELYLSGKIKRCDWTGRKHSKDTIEKMTLSKKGQGLGESNSQFGTCWITKDGENKKIKKEKLEDYLMDGWINGRK